MKQLKYIGIGLLCLLLISAVIIASYFVAMELAEFCFSHKPTWKFVVIFIVLLIICRGIGWLYYNNDKLH